MKHYLLTQQNGDAIGIIQQKDSTKEMNEAIKKAIVENNGNEVTQIFRSEDEFYTFECELNDGDEKHKEEFYLTKLNIY